MVVRLSHQLISSFINCQISLWFLTFSLVFLNTKYFLTWGSPFKNDFWPFFLIHVLMSMQGFNHASWLNSIPYTLFLLLAHNPRSALGFYVYDVIFLVMYTTEKFLEFVNFNSFWQEQEITMSLLCILRITNINLEDVSFIYVIISLV